MAVEHRATKTGWCTLIVAAVVAAPGLAWADVGVAWPHSNHVDLAIELTAIGLLYVVAGYVARCCAAAQT